MAHACRPLHVDLCRLGRRVAPLAVLAFSTSLAAVACSSDTKLRGGGSGDPETTGAGGTSGILLGEDGGIIGSGGSGSGSVACDATKRCLQDQICVKTSKGGICEPKGSPCS